MMNKKKQKVFVVRKYVMASNAEEALRKEKQVKPDDCWLDDDYKKTMYQDLKPAMGFRVNT